MIVATLAILGPLVAAALILTLRRGAAALALGGATIAAVAALVTLGRVAAGGRYAATLPGLPGLPLRLAVDPLAAVLATVVAVVALVVLLYAVGYMRGDAGQVRFYAGMSFFAGAMATLVLAGDWLLLLAAWELIGLASYLLIGFWFDRPGVPQAATRAFLTTRAADLGLYLGVFTLIGATGTSAIAPTLAVGGATATVAGLLLALAALGKAGQVPFHGWLQDAMTGPTPVSALLHSATLVAAGAILLIRAAPLLTGPVLLAIGLAGGLTALLTGLTALAQGDLKRLLAASTSSQLGFLFLALGAGSPGAAVAHLVAHAAMKGALFLGAGVFQHARGSTAFAELEGAGQRHPRVYAGFALAGLALAGVPPLAGFWSKDAILAATFASPSSAILAPLALVGTILTGAYVARALRLLWRGDGREEHIAGLAWMGTGLAALAALAVTLGLALRPLGAMLAIEIPEGIGSSIAGLVAAFVGLAFGWSVRSERFLGSARAWAARGFRLGGGFVEFVVRPTLALARTVSALDGRIDALVRRIGRGALAVAGATVATDRRDHATVEALGCAALMLAARSRRTDERDIDGLIAGLVRGTRDLAGRVRRVQTGLIHRELALAVAGVVVLLALLLLGHLLARA
jgi:NADH-quinone oxidoreductase subunit L